MADSIKKNQASPFVAVVVGLIKKDQSLLICERPPGKPYAGYWEFPGGKIEPQETAFDALKRELYEELAIKVNHAEPWMQHYHDYPDKSVQLNFWLVTDFMGEPKSVEGQALFWATAQDLQSKKLLEGNYVLVDEIQALLTS